VIRHILIFKTKASATDADISAAKQTFEEIPKKIAGIIGIEWGLNSSPEGKNQGFEYCVLMTFADEAARDYYLPHPKHNELKEVFGPILEDIIVIDYQFN